MSSKIKLLVTDDELHELRETTDTKAKAVKISRKLLANLLLDYSALVAEVEAGGIKTIQRKLEVETPQPEVEVKPRKRRAKREASSSDLDGVSGQDRESYSDTQDRDSYTVDASSSEVQRTLF